MLVLFILPCQKYMVTRTCAPLQQIYHSYWCGISLLKSILWLWLLLLSQAGVVVLCLRSRAAAASDHNDGPWPCRFSFVEFYMKSIRLDEGFILLVDQRSKTNSFHLKRPCHLIPRWELVGLLFRDICLSLLLRSEWYCTDSDENCWILQ